MKAVRSSHVLNALVNQFSKRYSPDLTTMQGAFGKCKFASYELALYLRSQGLRARVVHCQKLREGCPWQQTAHARWTTKPREDWSHYVVICGTKVFDLTARQFDSATPFPYRMTIPALKTHWETVEEDGFINRWIDRVLRTGGRSATRRLEKPAAQQQKQQLKEQ